MVRDALGIGRQLKRTVCVIMMIGTMRPDPLKGYRILPLHQEWKSGREQVAVRHWRVCQVLAVVAWFVLGAHA